VRFSCAAFTCGENCHCCPAPWIRWPPTASGLLDALKIDQAHLVGAPQWGVNCPDHRRSLSAADQLKADQHHVNQRQPAAAPPTATAMSLFARFPFLIVTSIVADAIARVTWQ
jgi:hypothetical protein